MLDFYSMWSSQLRFVIWYFSVYYFSNISQRNIYIYMSFYDSRVCFSPKMKIYSIVFSTWQIVQSIFNVLRAVKLYQICIEEKFLSNRILRNFRMCDAHFWRCMRKYLTINKPPTCIFTHMQWKFSVPNSVLRSLVKSRVLSTVKVNSFVKYSIQHRYI